MNLVFHANKQRDPRAKIPILAQIMKFLSVCSGIEAASVAFLPLGWECVGHSEIEPFPCAVLKHHYPNVQNYGDLTQQESWKLPAFDVLCGGTPCQGFSVAGKRGGLADARSQLVWHFLEIARRERPRWVLWENVPGVLSSEGGADFGAVLGRLGQCGYGFAYRILDAQYFGVAQRRRRVFVVGYLGDWRPAAAVLFERESMSGNPAPSRETGKSSAHPVSPCIGGSGSGRGFGRTGETRGQDPVVAHSLKGDGFDGSEDGSGRGVPLVPDVSPALKQRDLKGPSSDGDGDGAPLIPVIAFKGGQGAKSRSIGAQEECSPTLGSAESGSQRAPTIAFAIQERAQCENLAAGPGGGGIQENLGYMLEARNKVQAVGTICFRTDREPEAHGDLSPTLQQPSKSGGGQQHSVMTPAMSVRRLTPRECERLQGFPDDYTLVPHRNKPAADGPRYKALGNSWAVPCARYIAERIAQVQAWRGAS